jgi:hypothetical protein
MVVHIQYTSVTRRAVVTTIWLKYVANEAIATALGFVVAQVEAPEGRHLPWI